MEFILPILAGFTLGCIHAFDVDHIAAVTAFASKRPSAAGATKFGFLWGLGHTTTLIALGVLSIVFRFAIPPLMESIAETAVGLLLITIGVWVVWSAFRQKHLHIHKHTHDGVEHVHVHSHTHGEDHRHSHSMFWVGATHGFAGTAAVMVVVPVAISQSVFAASLYLLLFGIGTMTAMSIFAYTLGAIIAHVQSNSVLTWFQTLSGLASIAIGFLWVGSKII